MILLVRVWTPSVHLVVGTAVVARSSSRAFAKQVGKTRGIGVRRTANSRTKRASSVISGQAAGADLTLALTAD